MQNSAEERLKEQVKRMLRHLRLGFGIAYGSGKQLKELWLEADGLNLKEEKEKLGRILLNPAFYSGHTTRWNDLFYVLHKSGFRIKTYVLNVIRNGMFEYFEFETHEGYPLAELLKNEDIMEEEEFIRMDKRNYNLLSCDVIYKLAELYKVSQSEIEHIALGLCLAGLRFIEIRQEEFKDNCLKPSEFDFVDSSAARGWLANKGSIKYIARHFLGSDLKNAIEVRIQHYASAGLL